MPHAGQISGNDHAQKWRQDFALGWEVISEEKPCTDETPSVKTASRCRGSVPLTVFAEETTKRTPYGRAGGGRGGGRTSEGLAFIYDLPGLSAETSKLS